MGLAPSFLATGYSQNPDATTYYMIDSVCPTYLVDYNTAIAAFPPSNAASMSFVAFICMNRYLPTHILHH